MTRTKILLTGAKGQVGWELQRTLSNLGEVVALDSQALDLADGTSLRNKLREIAPQMIVNAAAYTAVDKAENDVDRAHAINTVAPGIFAEVAAQSGALLVHYSTDYVFDGSGTTPWREEDACSPLNVYGETKLAGERLIQASGCRHFIFRTSWVYGARGSNFLLTMRRLMRERSELKIVADQMGAPTWCRDLAEATSQIIIQLIASCGDQKVAPWGIYHMSNAGETSWHGFAQAIQALDIESGAHSSARLIAIPGSEYPTPAQRPLNSRLDNSKLERVFGLRLQDWCTALAQCMKDSL